MALPRSAASLAASLRSRVPTICMLWEFGGGVGGNGIHTTLLRVGYST